MAYFLLAFLFVCSWAFAEPVDGKESGNALKLKEVRGLNPEMRLKLWELSELPPDQLNAELSKWPRYQKMTPEKQQLLLQRMQDLKNSLYQMAAAKAKDYGLQIPPDQEDEFAKKYITRRLQEEKKLWDEIKPLRDKLESTLKDEMLKQYGTPP